MASVQVSSITDSLTHSLTHRTLQPYILTVLNIPQKIATMAASIASDNRPPYFYPASPSDNSALQHCSTTEIQLASTSMTGIDGCTNEEDSDMLISRSTIFPALLNNTSMSMLDREDCAGSLTEYSNSVNNDNYSAFNTGFKSVENTAQSEGSGHMQEHVASAARKRAFGLAKRLSGQSRPESTESR